MFLEIALMAFFIDRIFGEFSFIKHPVVFMGEFITWFEKKFYKDSILRGAILTITLILIVLVITVIIQVFLMM